jgi:chorismate synthase
MSHNTFGHLFRVTTWGESHGPALGCVVDGCPPGIALTEADIQPGWTAVEARPGQVRDPAPGAGHRAHPVGRVRRADRRPGHHRHAHRLMIENTDQRSKDYGEIARPSAPATPTIAYFAKYGVRDYRGGGRSSARETAAGSPPARSRAR